MPTLVDPRRRCVKFAEWPERDRALWEAEFSRPSSFDHTNVRERFRPASIAKAADGYGRWLGFLQFTGQLHEWASPADWVTPSRVRTYFDLMRELGNADHTLVGRIHELTIALGILAPDRDFRWLLKPRGHLLRSRLPMASRPLQVPDAKKLFEWGLEIAARGLENPAPRRRQVAIRDGLMIAVLASRAPRLSTLTDIQLGRNLVRNGAVWRLRFLEQEVKNHRPLEYDLPDGLTWLVDRYLGVEREELLDGRTSPFVWISWFGEKLEEVGVQKRILWLSKKRFGFGFGPHRFRHAVGTTVPDADPNSDGVGASLLGITPRVYRRHYDRSGQVRAAKEIQRNLQKARKDTAGRAFRAFGNEG